MKYKQMSKEEKITFGKQFSSKEKESYRKGKRNGFLNAVHKPDMTQEQFYSELVKCGFDKVSADAVSKVLTRESPSTYYEFLKPYRKIK